MAATDPTYRTRLAAALQDHRAGRLREAVAAYELLRNQEPQDADVLQLLGVALGQLGRHADTARLLARSLELKPDRPLVFLNLAQALRSLGQDEEALHACDRALSLDRTLAGAYRTRAAALLALGRREEALASAGQAVRLAMQDAGAHADLGVALEAVGRGREALECFERAVALDPTLAEAHHNRALLLTRSADHERAIESFDRALALQPQNAAVHSNRANTLKELGRLEEAVQGYSLALAIEPANSGALRNRAVAYVLLGKHANALQDYDALRALGKDATTDLIGRGTALVGLGRFGEALPDLERAVELFPDEVDAHVQRGVALMNLERDAEAVESFDRALALRPDVPDVLNNHGVALTRLGRMGDALSSLIRSSVVYGINADTDINMAIVLKALGRHREAAAGFSRALAARPEDPNALFGLACLYLSLGEFNRGWDFYEARFRVPEFGNPARHFNMPRWNGQDPLAGKTLLVHAEQGLGDVIQFCRYLPLLADRGARVVFEVMPNVKALLGTLPGTFGIVGRGEPLPQADYYIPLLSIPLVLNTQLDTIPAQVPYIAAQPERVARWKERLRNLSGLRVGIAWQGNPVTEKHVWARGRSMPLAALEPLAQLTNVSLIALQKGPGTEQLREVGFRDRIVDLGPDFDQGLDAFLDTAAVMTNLDLVISPDTSIVHLAGALGRPVWTALSSNPDWRWLLDRSDSPWYPTMRLFRQPANGGWTPVVAAIAEALESLTAAP